MILETPELNTKYSCYNTVTSEFNPTEEKCMLETLQSHNLSSLYNEKISAIVDEHSNTNQEFDS